MIITHELTISSAKSEIEKVEKENYEKNDTNSQFTEQTETEQIETEQLKTLEFIQTTEHFNNQSQTGIEIQESGFTETTVPVSSFSPPSPKRIKLLDDYSNKFTEFTKPEDTETNSITSVGSSTKSIKLNSGAMIDIPVHQKITYSRRRKIRAKEVSEKLDKLDKSDVGELQLRDWIYVKPLEGEQKSKFQIMREEHEKRVEVFERQNRESEDLKTDLLKNDELSFDNLENSTLETPSLENPTLRNPTLENPTLENPTLEKPAEKDPSIPSPEKSIDHFSGIHFKLNETGELIFHQETINKQVDKSQFLKDSSSKFDEMDKYKRCLVKGNKKKVSNRKWNEKENDLFWKALANVGQDFQLLEN